MSIVGVGVDRVQTKTAFEADPVFAVVIVKVPRWIGAIGILPNLSFW